MILHHPIVDKSDRDFLVEFSHITEDAQKEHWKKERLICLNHIKINIFVHGCFSVFSGGNVYTPTYGDLCVFSPNKIHSGHIPSPTHIDYFQLDIGINAFYGIPGGITLLEKLIFLSDKRQSFIKPNDKDIQKILSLCYVLDKYVTENNNTAAFIKSAEIVSEICSIFSGSSAVAIGRISPITEKIIKYIEDNYGNEITLEGLSRLLNVSTSYISRVFKADTGMGVHSYLNEYRLIKSAEFLKYANVTDTCYKCGFSDTSHFIAVFKKRYNCTPKQFITNIKYKSERKKHD